MFLSDYMMESKSVDDPGRDSRPRAFGVSSVAMDGSVTRCSTSGDETSTHSDDKYAFLTCRDGGKSVMILKNDDTGKRRAQTLVTIFIALIVATLFFLMVFFTTRKVQENGTSSSASSHSELCPLVVDDTREPQLEIYFTGLSKEPTDEEKEQLKRAIMKGYNEAVGGCRDHFKRWMYQVDLVNAEAQDEIIIMTESSTDLQNRFDDVSAFVARFRTKISCDGCPHEEAFASVYPPVFGSNIVPPGNRRRTSDELNAADIVLAIEREVHDTMPDFDSFLEFSVLTQREDGSAISTTLMREINYGAPIDEFYNPSFFREKVIEETQRAKDCRKDDKKKRAKSRKGDSGSSSKSDKSSKSGKGDNGKVPAAVSVEGAGCRCSCFCDVYDRECDCECQCEPSTSSSGGVGDKDDDDDEKQGKEDKKGKAEKQDKKDKADKQDKADKEDKADKADKQDKQDKGEKLDGKTNDKCEEEGGESRNDGKQEKTKKRRKKIRRIF